MGDSPVKDFFDLDMKDKMRIIESRKKLEKDLIRVVYAPVLLTCKAGVEKRYNDGLTAITTVAEEGVQVVGKQLISPWWVNLLKMYRRLFKKKLGNLNLSSQELLFKYGIWSDSRFLINFKNYVKSVDKEISLRYNNLCKQKEVEKPTGLQDQ